jgi:GT2 family glycosyltransferase
VRVAASLVLYHADLEELRVSLAALREWPHGPLLVHLNDASDDVDAHAVRQLLPAATVTWSRENRGFAGGHNALLATAFAAGADAVVVHNPDLVMEPGAVEALVLAAEANTAPCLLGPLLELAEPRSFRGEARIDTEGIVWTRSSRHLDASQGEPLASAAVGSPRRVAGISGACLFVSQAAYDAVLKATGEFFDEEFLAYREDAELAFRSALVGVPSFLVPAARGRHARGSRGTERGRSALVDWLGVRNRFLMAAKYGRHRPGGLVLPLARDLVVVAGVLLRERTSLSALRDAWRLRTVMRAKGRKAIHAASLTSKQAARL